MKICMIAYSFYESDSRVMQYAHALIERGDEVDVIALAYPGLPRFEVIDGVNVYRVQKRELNERKALSYLVRILRFLFVALFTLTLKHMRRRYKLVHVHSVPDFLVFSALPLRMLGVPVILDIHDILPEFFAGKFGVGRDSLIFKAVVIAERLSTTFASHVIIANHLWYKRLLERGVPARKLTAIGNFPDPKNFYLRPRRKPDGRFLLMYPGSLNWHQGVDLAIQAFAKISSRIKNAEFQIYGEGPMRKQMEEMVVEFGLQEKVHINDYRSTDEIAGIMATADLAVVPKRASSSFGNEAASTKIQEFMAVGVPVVVSRTKIDTFYFDDSKVRFFESENVDALAEAIVDLYENPSERERLVEGANHHIEKNNWGVQQFEYLHVVDALTRDESNVVKEYRSA
jgi:glycosyltransferase involved in cell wall biosynthesis